MQTSRRSFLFLVSAMMAAGYLASEASVVLPSLIQEFSLDGTQAGYLVSVRFVGGILAGSFLFLLGDRIPFRRLLQGTAVIIFLSALLLPFASGYTMVMIISAVRGPTLTLLIATTNGALATWFHRKPGKWTTRVHSFFGVGLILAPVLGFLAVNLGLLGWRWVWAVPAVLAGMLWLSSLKVPAGRSPRGIVAQEEEPVLPQAGEKGAQRSWSGLSPALWLFILALAFFTVGTEALIVGWTPAYLAILSVDVYPPELAALFVAVGVFLGRQFLAPLSEKLGPPRIHTTAVVSIAGLSLVMLFVPLFRPWAAALLGFATAGLYTMMVARIGPLARRSKGRVFPAIELAASAGGTIAPGVVGFFTDRVPAAAFPLGLLAGTAALSFFLVSLHRREARDRGTVSGST
ncbi:MAG: MFS transporter [Spirochaetales bacterium]|nr:MFS transporter [Spirochaetales bacterium]MCF7937688.1 MFS transporter [Spirochaetales bacterium]